MPLRNCLKRPESAEVATAKCSGANVAIGGNSTRGARKRVSPGRSDVALTRPMMSPGNASSSTVRSRPKSACAYFVANGRPLCACVTTMPRSKTPDVTRAKATRSRWLVSMPA